MDFKKIFDEKSNIRNIPFEIMKDISKHEHLYQLENLYKYGRVFLHPLVQSALLFAIMELRKLEDQE